MQGAPDAVRGSEHREKAALERYIGYMHEQQLQLDESLPQLSSPLELSRSSASTSEATTARAAQHDTSVVYGSLPSASDINNDVMRRFLALMQPGARQGAGDSDADSDEDRATVTTAAAPLSNASASGSGHGDASTSATQAPAAGSSSQALALRL